MLPWPNKCNSCLCRMCRCVETCNIGDGTQLHPCDACGGPYITCRLPISTPAVIEPQAVVDAFNRLCPSLPRARGLTAQRRKSIRAREASLSEFEEVFRLAEASEFLSGRSGDWTGCGFDWLLKPTNWQKVLEGTYNKNSTKKAAPVSNALNYDQKRYTEKDLAHIFVNLEGDFKGL